MEINTLYNLVFEGVVPLLRSRIFWNAVMLGIGTGCLILAAVRFLNIRGCIVGFGLAIFFALIVFFVKTNNLNERVQEKAHAISNVAINEGVAKAQEAHATQLQLIHANVSVAGTEVQQCQRSVNYHDFCSSNTPWYTHREINVHWDESCTTDNDGDKSCTRTRDWDDEYTPWFTHIVRYYVIADTKVKYLDSSYYDIANRDQPKAKPMVYLTAWRAPEDALNNIYMGEWPGSYDNRVPQFWAEVRNRSQSGGAPVLATFVGKYFHWLHAEESAQYEVFNGHYERMKNLVNFPGPQGLTITIKDGYGDDMSIKSDLVGDGDGPPLDYRPVTDLAGIDSDLLDQLNTMANNLQGHAGPNLQVSIKWFVVQKGVVDQMGGTVETTQAIKAYLADESVWGKFSLPKNEVIELIVINDDASCIVGRDMETGMPFGNVLVAQDHRLSIAVGECVPFTAENAIGQIDGRYTNNDIMNLTYAYPDLSMAGGATSILYQKTPGYESPDPDSDECTTTPPEHHGFVRYSMCTQEYRRSNIQMNEKDISLIVQNSIRSAKEQTRLIWGIVVLIVGLMLLAFEVLSNEQNGY